MAIVNGSVELGYNNTAWFTANPTIILLVGQIVYLEQTGTYKLGDGVTALSALSWLGDISIKENVANKSSSYTASSTTTYANTKALVDGLATKGVGTILGTVGATATFGVPIPYNNGVANTVTSSPFLALYNSGALTLMIQANTSTIHQQGYLFDEGGQYSGLRRYGSALTTTLIIGTSFPLSNVIQLQAGNNNQQPIVLLGTPIIHGIGQTSTNVATRHDATGWRQGTMADIHTANTVPFEVGGVAKFNNVTRLMTYSNASPTEGDLWKTATEFNMQRNSITEQIASKNDALLYAMSF